MKYRSLAFIGYLVFCIYILYHSQLLLRFTFLFPLLVPLFLLTIPKRELQAVKDWSLFYIFIFIYDFFRSLAPSLNPRVNLFLLGDLESLLFNGTFPTIFIQQKLGIALEGSLGAILTFFYMTHFILPVLVLYFLWKKSRREYFFAISCLLLLSFLAFLTFLIFPASPPWHASINGAIPEIKQYLFINTDKLFGTSYISDLHRSLNSNPYAPFPSLHSAYPLLLFLISLRFFKKYSLLFLLVALVVPFTLVAFGEHYVVDVIAGWVYTIFSFLVISAIFRKKV